MGVHLASAYRRALEFYGTETEKFKVTDNIASYFLDEQ
jgi:hypothetical protein